MRALLPLVRGFGRLPAAVGSRFAALLDAVNGPFDLVNLYGSRVGAKIIGHRRMGRVIAVLHRRLDAETAATLTRSMAFPTRWDPFFCPVMSLAEVYRYPCQHFEVHRRQLTLGTNDDSTLPTL